MNCQVCGEKFTPRAWTARYCSAPCRAEAKRANNLERQGNPGLLARRRDRRQARKELDPDLLMREAAQARERRRANPEHYRAYMRQYLADNPDVLERKRIRSREWYARNRDYVARQKMAHRTRLKELVPNPRRSRWTPAEDAIVLREDITLIEMVCMLQRTMQAVKGRRLKLLRRAETERSAA